jgi:predicted aspartyl protease
LPVNVGARKIGLCEGGATEVDPPKRADAASEMSERKNYSAQTSIVDKWEQEFVNIYYINENNFYGCPHVQLDVGEERLIAILDTGAEISLVPERIFEDLLAKGVRAPQLPVVNGALITAFGSRTKRIKRQTLIEFERDGFSYEQVFMIAPNLVPDAILGINFLKENNVVINLTEGSFKKREGMVLIVNISSSMVRCRRTKWKLTLYQTRFFN